MAPLRVRNSNIEVNRFELSCLTYKLFLEILGHMFGDEIQKKENLPYGWLLQFDQCELIVVMLMLHATFA